MPSSMLPFPLCGGVLCIPPSTSAPRGCLSPTKQSILSPQKEGGFVEEHCLESRGGEGGTTGPATSGQRCDWHVARCIPFLSIPFMFAPLHCLLPTNSTQLNVLFFALETRGFICHTYLLMSTDISLVHNECQH